MIKQIAKIILFALLSIAGGIFGSRIAYPYLIGKSLSGNIIPQSPVNVIQKQETTIQENKALKTAVEKTTGTIIGVKISNSNGVAAFGSGVILTSDGLAAIPYSLFVPGSEAQITAGGKVVSFQVLKRDKTKNLVIIKLEKSNWPTASFYQLDNLKLGERIFLAGMLADGTNFVNEGIVRDFNQAAINTNIIEKTEANGSPIFDIEGRWAT